jgi:predicted DNA-binding transcriptional regulator AlpA
MYAATEVKTKAAVSVAEMARMVGLSRARFYQLIGATFPPPLYTEVTRRPFYDEELQAVCLDVRRRNCGIDGKPVLFYARRPLAAPVPGRKPKKAAGGGDKYADLVDGLKSLGLAGVTAAQVAEAVKEMYPNGVPETTNGEVLRAVFLHLRRRNTSDNVSK